MYSADLPYSCRGALAFFIGSLGLFFQLRDELVAKPDEVYVAGLLQQVVLQCLGGEEFDLGVEFADEVTECIQCSVKNPQ